MWNPFKKAKNKMSSAAIGMMQSLAMKKLAKMSEAEKQKMVAEMMNPKNQGKLLAALEAMKKAGQVSEEQYRMAKDKLGKM